MGNERLTEHLLGVAGACVSIAKQCDETLQRMERIFLLNEGLDIHHFLLAEKGVVRYPEYECKRLSAAFASRAQLLEYESALRVRCALASRALTLL
jgi:fanconi-associated nuclease 1